MEDVLEVYRRPYDPMRPVVCMDESTKQLLAEVRMPIAGRIGAPQRYDSEYRRNGVASLFLAFEPLAGWRQVKVTEQRTRRDWARFIKGLLDTRYPDCASPLCRSDPLADQGVAAVAEAIVISASDIIHAVGVGWVGVLCIIHAAGVVRGAYQGTVCEWRRSRSWR